MVNCMLVALPRLTPSFCHWKKLLPKAAMARRGAGPGLDGLAARLLEDEGIIDRAEGQVVEVARRGLAVAAAVNDVAGNIDRVEAEAPGVVVGQDGLEHVIDEEAAVGDAAGGVGRAHEDAGVMPAVSARRSGVEGTCRARPIRRCCRQARQQPS